MPMVTAPVAPLTLMLVPATAEVTPVLLTVSDPAPAVMLMPVPVPRVANTGSAPVEPMRS